MNETTQSKGKYDPGYIKYRFIAMGISVSVGLSVFRDVKRMKPLKFKRHLETQMYSFVAFVAWCIVGPMQFVVK